MNLSSTENFFITVIKQGLRLQGEVLTDFDLTALTSVIDTDSLEELDKLFDEHGINKVEWNNRMVEALKNAFEDDINNIKSDKEMKKRIGVNYQPPHETWDIMIKSLIEDSNLVLSGIVQNWDQKYWSMLARKSATKTMATGCLLPTVFTILIMVLIPFLMV